MRFWPGYKQIFVGLKLSFTFLADGRWKLIELRFCRWEASEDQSHFNFVKNRMLCKDFSLKGFTCSNDTLHFNQTIVLLQKSMPHIKHKEIRSKKHVNSKPIVLRVYEVTPSFISHSHCFVLDFGQASQNRATRSIIRYQNCFS